MMVRKMVRKVVERDFEPADGRLPVESCPVLDAGLCHVPCILSGITVGQLGLGEQLLVWALRQRRRDGDVSETLARGFRLAFGLAGVEDAVACFDELYRALTTRPYQPLGICCLRCALLSADEWAVIELTAAAAAGKVRRAAGIAGILARPPGDLAAAAAARRLGSILVAADLPVTPRRAPAAALASAGHGAAQAGRGAMPAAVW
jgi:hypothetical protein